MTTSKKQSELDINPQFKLALDLMEESSKSIFITGKAGTGKSTLLEYFRANTEKNPVVLAPTGVAALNVKGQTIHSFFNFYIDVTPQKILTKKIRPKDPEIYKNLKIIIIDEVSMLRADLLDCIDVFLQIYGPIAGEKFGGVQMIFVGDLYQLPPVVTSQEREIFNGYYNTPYFFSAHALNGFKIEIVELEKVYRQKDERFIHLLNLIRNNSIEADDIRCLNSRHIPNFKPDTGKFYISLTTTNKKADEINDEHLQKLKTKTYNSEAVIEGDFGKEYFPTAVNLELKEKAQIMLLNNDSSKRWVNGTVGVIEKIEKDEDGGHILKARIQDSNKLVTVSRFTWKVYRFFFDGQTIASEEVGTFTQFPLRLAWAVTIHKSQGKTFDNIIIDIGRGTFAAGQTYVGLSRCTSFEGIVLKEPIKKHHIRTDYRIFKFLTEYQYKKSAMEMSIEDKIKLIKHSITNNVELNLTYLKANDTKSKRVIIPLNVGEENYKGKSFLGMTAFCTKRQEERMFRIDRILKLEQV